MSKSPEQETLDKILESCQDEIELAVKKSFFNYLIYGDTKCPFCEIPCNNEWCDYTEKKCK